MTVRIRGIRQNIPSGYMLGRVSSGKGPPELVPIKGLAQRTAGSTPGSGIASTSIVANLPLTSAAAPGGAISLSINKATTSTLGVVQPDGTSITIDPTTGVISAMSSGGGVTSLTANTPLTASASTGAVTLSVNLASASQLGVVQLDGTTIVTSTADDTFDPSHIQSGNVLSNGNLTVTGPTSGNYAGVISTNLEGYAGQSVKLYYEVTAVSVTSSLPANPAPCIGISNGIVFTDPGSDNNSLTAQSSGGIYSNGSQVGSNETWTSGDVLAVAIDLGAKKFWIKNLTTGGWNQGTGGTQDPASGAGGISFSAFNTGSHECVIEVWTTGHWGTSDVMTLNTGASSFTGTLPAGFSAWSAAPTLISIANPVTLVLDNSTLEGTTVLPNGGSINNSVSNCMALLGTNNGNMLATVQNTSNGAAAFCGTQWLNDASNYAIFGIVGSGFTPAIGIKAANTAYFVSNTNLAIISNPIQFSTATSPATFAECARFDTNGFLLLGYTSAQTYALGSLLQINGNLALNGTLIMNNSADFSTGSGTAALGTANCPATSPSAPTKWVKIVVPGTIAGYIPVWE